MKHCQKCNKEIPPTMIVNGKVKWNNTRKNCIECSPFRFWVSDPTYQGIKQRGYKNWTEEEKQKSRDYENLKNHERKLFYINQAGGKCKHCGYLKCPRALSFHHRNPKEKEFGLNKLGKKSESRVKNELLKCDLLCMNCHSEIEYELLQKTTSLVKEQMKTRKQKLVNLKGGKCIICNYSKCLAGLCFHHRNPEEKEFQLINMARSWENLLKEADKCDLVCHNCHMEIHSISISCSSIIAIS